METQQSLIVDVPEGAIRVLDHGFVSLVDVMGDDNSIVQAARVSYGKGTKTKTEDSKLIDYLYKNRHTTPFEMVEFKFVCRMPIFVARQWVRHRTASINEYSGRYSEMPEDMYLPPLQRIQGQDSTNKQASDGIKIEDASLAQQIMADSFKSSWESYQHLLSMGVSRELARVVLPLSSYTEWYWKINMHNLFNFLRLRMDSHAQGEMQLYANAMAKLVEPVVPAAWAAFQKWQFPAIDTSA